jgi:hypothetical protein
MPTLTLRIRQHGRLATIRGIDIESIEQSATVSRVPGSQFGMALVRGQIIPVLRLGDAEGCLVVGRVRGEVVGLVGFDIVGFNLDEEAIAESELDIDALIARAKLQQRFPSQPLQENS